MSEYPELDRLVRGIRQRDNSAFAELHRLVAGSLATFANSMVRDRHTSEDIVQQAFLELARAAHTIDGDGRTLRAWLFRAVRFGCLDEIRRRGRRPEVPTDALPDRIGTGGVEVEWDPDIAAALGSLTEKQRNLIILKHVIGLSGRDLAAVMEISRGAAYAATERAERALKRALGAVESAAGPAFQPLPAGDDTE